MAKNMVGEVGIAEHLHRSNVISTSGLLVIILNSGNQPTSGNVGSVRDVSSMVANVEVSVGIVLPARCVHYLFSLPVSTNVGKCRAMLTVSYACRARSKMWE